MCVLQKSHNQGVLGSSPSGTTRSESKTRKNPENQRFSGFFLFARHRKIRQNEAFRVGLSVGHDFWGQCKNMVEVLKNGPDVKSFRRIVLRAGKGRRECLSRHGTDCGKP